MSATVRGSVAESAYRYLRENYGDDLWRQTLARLSDEDMTTIHSINAFTRLPVAVDGRVIAAFVDVAFAGDRSAADRAFRKAGGSQADHMLRGIFSVFARFTSPRQAFLRTGSIVTSVYDGVSHDTEERPEGNGGTLVIRGLAESSYVVPWQCGWIERAFVHFGSANCTCTEESWTRGRVASDELVFDIRY